MDETKRYSRSVAFREDASRIRAGHRRLANAVPDNLALAIVRRRGEECDTVPQARIYLGVRRDDASAEIPQPT